MRLVFRTGVLTGKSFKIAREAVMGRDATCSVCIPDDAVSSRQCKIFFQAGRPYIQDLKSTNDTLLNDLVVELALLSDGDVISIGESEAVIEMVVESSIISGADPSLDLVAEADSPEPKTATESSTEGDDIFATTTYRLKRKIAIGGMGTVYEAEQDGAEGFTKTVVIKAILPKYSNNKEFVEMFIGEAKLVADLVHQNIVQIYQLGRYDQGLYIAMEYIDGIDLSQFVYRHRRDSKIIPVEIATFITSRVCRGLEYAHNKRDEKGRLLGIVHRDVAPKNIMMTNEGEVKLTDFGVAKAAHHMVLQEGEFLVGSYEYMSPEQASYKTTDGRSDIFALGLVYYELLTGERIQDYETIDDEELLEKIKECVIPDPRDYRPDLPAEVVDVLMKCLQADPADRYQHGGEFGYALEYQMYSKGYGPTIVTLAKYLAEIFPERDFFAPESQKDESIVRGAE